MLGDFGLTRILKSGYGTVGAFRYMAPELVTEGVRNKPSDIWAFGCTAT